MPDKNAQALARLGLPANATQAEVVAAVLAKVPPVPKPAAPGAAAPEVPTYVRAFAARHKVDLSKVSPKSADEGVTLMDICEYAKQSGDGDLQLQALSAQFDWNSGGRGESQLDGPTRDSRASAVRPARPEDAYALSPLVDRVRSELRAQGRPVPTSPAPTLFASGDLPSFTASGIPPRSLLEVPWQARHAMASAATAAEAYAIREECLADGGSNPAETARLMFGNHDGNHDYARRVQQWQVTSLSDRQLASSVLPGALEEQRRREDQRTEAFNASLRAGAAGDPDADATIRAMLGGRHRVSNGRTPGEDSR